MERLARLALYLAMGVGVTFFVLFLIAALPTIIESSWKDWERLDRSDRSQDAIYEKLISHPAYAAMYEAYPDAKEEFSYGGRGSGNMRVGIMDFETYNRLTLDLYYNTRDDQVSANVYCTTQDDRRGLDAHGLFAEDFVRNTNCLKIIDGVENDIEANSQPTFSD